MAGAYDVCSPASADLCTDECNVRIEMVENLCASCLLEDADFGVGGDGVSLGDYCENGQCEKNGREGTCTYPQGDDAAEDGCTREVYPRREISCDSEFRDVLDCAPVC